MANGCYDFSESVNTVGTISNVCMVLLLQFCPFLEKSKVRSVKMRRKKRKKVKMRRKKEKRKNYEPSVLGRPTQCHPSEH